MSKKPLHPSSDNPDHALEIGVQPTGHFKNQQDQQVLGQFDSREARDDYLDDDDAELPGETTDEGAQATTLEADTDDGADDAGTEATTEQQAGETDAERAAREAAEAQATSQADDEAAATAAKANEQQQVQAPPPAPQLPRFQTRTAQELAEASKQAMQKKAEAFKQYSDGTLEPDAFMAIDMEVTAELAQITAESTLMRMNAEAAQMTDQQAIAQVQAQAKAAGLDYATDQSAVEDFNAAVDMLAKGRFASLPPDQFYAKAHQQVLLLRGMPITPAPAAAPAAPAVQQVRRADKAAPAVPTTIRSMPAAANPNTNGGVEEELSRLASTDPLAFQNRIGSMDRAKRDAWLDS